MIKLSQKSRKKVGFKRVYVPEACFCWHRNNRPFASAAWDLKSAHFFTDWSRSFRQLTLLARTSAKVKKRCLKFEFPAQRSFWNYLVWQDFLNFFSPVSSFITIANLVLSKVDNIRSVTVFDSFWLAISWCLKIEF